MDNKAKIYYHDIGDYLDRDEKLRILADADGLQGVAWQVVTPNAKYDWINQRDECFDAFIEQLELWLKRYPDIVRIARIDPIDSPLNVAPDELAEIIEALVLHKDDLKGSLPVARTSLAEKDRLNQMTEDYSKELRRRYLSHTNSIQAFLADPLNEDLQKKYDTAAQEFNFKIITNRQDYQLFDAVMEHLFDVLFRDPILAKNRGLTRALLFYMYWNCDIGKTTEDENAETI